MEKKFMLPAIALLGGILGFILRKWQLATAFDLDTGLMIGIVPATVLLILLSVVMAGVLVVLSPNRLIRGKKGYHDAFCAKDCPFYPVVSTVAAAGVLVAGLIVIYQGATADVMPLTQMILGCACVVTALFMMGIIKITKGSSPAKGYIGGLLAPAFLSCLWLVVAYQGQAANPIAMDYMFGLLAIICLLLGYYQMAGFSFEKPKVWGMCVCSLFGVYLTLVAVADAYALWEYVLYLAMALFLLMHTVQLLGNVQASRGGTRTKQEN